MVEDLTIFTEGEFSIGAVLTLGTNPSVTVRGIFDDEYAAMLNGETEGRLITFEVISAVVGGVRHGDTLLIEGKTYAVHGVQPVGDGKLTDLELKLL
jgi:hypothetical protein